MCIYIYIYSTKTSVRFVPMQVKESWYHWYYSVQIDILVTISWDKIFKKGPSDFCGRLSFTNFTWSILEYFVPVVHD